LTIDILSLHLQFPMWVVVVLGLFVAVIGSGRVTRVIVYDDFPPTIWLRMQWDKLTDDNSWNKLFHCFWCMSHWVMLLCIGWFWIGLFVQWIGWSWWLFFGWFALSYLQAMLIARDEPSDGGE
jgi:hypothetical protein